MLFFWLWHRDSYLDITIILRKKNSQLDKKNSKNIVKKGSNNVLNLVNS